MKRLIPRYAIWPIICMLGINFFTYSITPIWTRRLYHHSMMTVYDDLIPFLPIFVIPYILAYVQWIVGFLLITRTDEKYCKKIFYGEIAAKLIVCLLFVLVPTTMERATITESGICADIVAFIYKIDQPMNLFPSIHCLESWICFRGSLNRKYFSIRYAKIMGLATILVMLSTVFIKQHVILDAVGAIIVAEIGLGLGKIRVYMNHQTAGVNCHS